MNVKIDIDSLAQEIRRVDGNHSLGAGALAEALLPFMREMLAEGGDVPTPLVMDDIIAGLNEIIEHCGHCNDTVQIGTVSERVTQRIEDRALGMRNMIVALRDAADPSPVSSLSGIKPAVTGQMEIDQNVTAADLGVNADPSTSADLDQALSLMDRCVHDGGFDRETGPIGCYLGDKCVCIGIYPLIASARAALSATATEGAP